MKKLFILLAVVLSACVVPQTSETKEDSVAVLSQDTLPMAKDVDQAAIDTIFTNLNLEKKFKQPQLDASVAYIYDKEDSGYREKVKIIRKHDGLAEVEFSNGGRRDVMIDYLLPFPVPETDDVVKYFLANLMILEDPVERKKPESTDSDMFDDGTFSFIDYKFEGGFTVLTGSQYESGFTNVRLPGLSVKQAFLFASYFYEDFGLFDEYPTKERDEELPEDRHIMVAVEDGEATVIAVGNGSGCYWEEGVSGTEYGAVMTSSGGC